MNQLKSVGRKVSLVPNHRNTCVCEPERYFPWISEGSVFGNWG